MKNSWKALCVCACVAIGISAALPFFSVSGFGVTVISRMLMDGNEGIFVLVIAAVALVFSVLGMYAPTIFLGVGSLVLFFVENNSLKTNLGRSVDTLVRMIVQEQPGYYCLLIGSIALIAFSVLGAACQQGRITSLSKMTA